MVERLTSNEKIPGSIPGGGNEDKFFFQLFLRFQS